MQSYPRQSKIGTTSPQTFPSAVNATNLIVVSIGISSAAGTITSISDNKSNTYHPIGAPNGVSVLGQTMTTYYAWNCNGGVGLQVSVSASAGLFLLNIFEFAGIQSSADPLDAHNETSANASSTAYAKTAPVVTTLAGDLLFGALNSFSGPLTTAGLLSIISPDQQCCSGLAYNPGTYYYDATQSGSQGAWTVNFMAFKAANPSIPFGQVADVFVDFQGGTAGSAFNITNWTADIHGGDGTPDLSSAGTNNTHRGTSASPPLLVTAVVNSQQYSGASNTLGFQTITTNPGSGYVSYFFFGDNVASKVSCGFWMQWNIPDNDSSANRYSLLSLHGVTSEYCNPQLSNGQMYLENSAGRTIASITVHANTWYWITMLYNSGKTHYMSIWDINGNFIGALSKVATGVDPCYAMYSGVTGTETETVGQTIWQDNILLNYTSGDYPLGVQQTVSVNDLTTGCDVNWKVN